MTSFGSIGRTVVAIAVLMTAAHAQDLNDYPTSARVEYVFGCLKANGETRQAIEQCSCSIDVVASLVPYERYVMAETVLSMSQVRGNLGSQFRTSEQATSALNDLRRAQAASFPSRMDKRETPCWLPTRGCASSPLTLFSTGSSA